MGTCFVQESNALAFVVCERGVVDSRDLLPAVGRQLTPLWPDHSNRATAYATAGGAVAPLTSKCQSQPCPTAAISTAAIGRTDRNRLN